MKRMLLKPLSASILYVTAATALMAQDGQPANDYASAAPSEPLKVNTEAWDSFISFNGERIMGDPADHQYVPSLTYYTSYASAGKRIARDTIVPSFSTSGPLFGGDGYGTFSGVLPFDSQYAKQFNGIGGWKYHLMEKIDIDVGGGFGLYDKNSFGEGQPNGFGSWYRSKLYLGFIGDFMLQPAAYFVYDTQLEQVQGVFGISEKWNLAENWDLFAEARAGYLNANSYFGDSGPPAGGKWQNGYAYVLTSLEINWTPFKNAKVGLGVSYTANNDGTTGFANIDMGPEDTVYGKFSLSYAF